MELSEEKLNRPCGILIKTTLVDFPGRVASTVFLEGCNLRCPYCYNRDLVLKTEPETNLSSVNEIVEHLEKRKNVLTGFVISGGEALLNPVTPYLIKAAKNLNLKVKLDTNGTLPDLLEKLIANPETKPDFIAMDIKTSPHNYSSLMHSSTINCAKQHNKAEDDGTLNETQKIDFTPILQKTIKIVSQYPVASREFRTVLVPRLVSKEDIKEIAELLPKDASWQFAQFRNENCLNPEFNEILPYLEKEVQELVDFAHSFIPGAVLR